MRLRSKGPPVQGHLPVGGRHEPADNVEQRRLAGPVRPDDADNPPRFDPQRDVVECKKPAEADSQVVEGKPLIRC
jgi:hypothetical protein